MSADQQESSLLPPFKLNAQGEPRRVGVELELSGLELKQITEHITDVLGGRVLSKSPYEAHIQDTEVGTVRVEFDATLFRELKVRRFFDELDLDILGDPEKESIEKVLATVAAWLVPYEIVFPPLPVAELGKLEKVRARLGVHGQGTTSNVINAFGLHLNPEVPNTNVETVLNYLRAFLILYDELKQVHDIDVARSLSGFISPFEKRYQLLVLNPKYKPTKDQFIDDYLQANPSRNRPLDLLPLLAYMDETKVRQRLPEEKISPRPAFHYRLPNSQIDERGWSISREWEAWLRVERLAADSYQLKKRCLYHMKRLQGPFWYWLKRFWRTKPLLSNKPMIAVTGPDKGGFPAWICTYLAVRRAGGYPVRLTPRMFRHDPTLPPFDGLILGGGADIDPKKYGKELQAIFEEPESKRAPKSLPRRILGRVLAPILFVWRALFSLTASGVDRARDDFESACLDRAVQLNLPVLGICRGAQFINTHLGGTLVNGLESFYGEVAKKSTVLPTTAVELKPGSYLHSIIGLDRLKVNSLHNQAVEELGNGIRVTAQDQTGMVQALEVADAPWIMGVQWHPEYLPVSRVQQRLFLALVQEALSRKR